MNTIKFQKIYLPATEQHNLELEETKDVVINGKTYTISVPCNINIIVTDKCPCNCFFCIEHQTIQDIEKGNSNNYLAGLEDILSQLPSKYFEITITGGEPTVDSERLIKVMELCKKYGYNTRTFSTTGYNFNEYPIILDKMIECGFTHNINISRMSVNGWDNAEIFKCFPNNNYDIQKWAQFFKYHNAEMRLSCNLIKGLVDSMDKIYEYVDYYNNIGVDSMLFRELVEQSSKYDFKDRIVKIEDIFNDSSMIYIETLQSDYYIVDVYQWRDFIVKHYKTNPKHTNNISTLSYKNGILRIGFIGDKIYEYNK